MEPDSNLTRDLNLTRDSKLTRATNKLTQQCVVDSVLCTSQFQNLLSPPPPPGHLTLVKLCTVGNLTQNEARPVGHLTFLSKRLSAGRKQKDFAILWISTRVVFTGHCSCRFHVGFFCCCRFIELYHGMCLCLKRGAKTSWTRNS